MLIYPAIDIRHGRCVRLTEGKFDEETVFSENPKETALRWYHEGAEFLHVVDLDGALAGKPVNLPVIREIVRAVDIPVQVGGGIRSMATIEAMINFGVRRVILGSIAVKHPELVRQACAVYGEKIVVGIDARNGQVAVEGWEIDGKTDALTLAKSMVEQGVSRIIYTDISRDGTLKGVNVEGVVAVAEASGVPVIASGGVASLDDIRTLRAVQDKGVEGVIVGKAIYVGTLTLAEAIQEGR